MPRKAQTKAKKEKNKQKKAKRPKTPSFLLSKN